MIILDMSDKRPLYEQITERFIELICKGVMNTNEQLPSVRSLAVELSINPNTIQRAYSELERAGYIYTVKGKGNFVADIKEVLFEQKNVFYDELKRLLEKAENYSIRKKEIVDYVSDFFINED